jgi:two-component system response regulator HydG
VTRKMRILVVDDHTEMVRLLAEELGEAGYEVIEASGGAQALELARRREPDLAITDLRMAGVDGLDVLAGLLEIDPEMPVVIMTAFGSIDTAVDAMRRGAWTYLTKPFRTDELLVQVKKGIAHRSLAAENHVLRRLVTAAAPTGMIGVSAPMRAVYAMVARLADSDVPVLIRGESGTGKERVARALHAGGARRDAPFVAVNCASVPASLLESELFGHLRGAFTGATGARRGLFVQADGGTLFLDEIGDMPLELQAHLLRVLEDRVVRPVGADIGATVDVRIVTATHQDLEGRVAAGRFRSDLFYRLDVVPIRLPPLRERVDDIPELFAAFIAKAAPTPVARLSAESMAILERYPWPGNVRELENLVRRLALLVDHPLVTPEDLRAHAPQLLAAKLDSPLDRARATLPTLKQLETDYLAWVLDRCGGNKTRAAEVLGVDVSTIHRRTRGVDGGD